MNRFVISFFKVSSEHVSTRQAVSSAMAAVPESSEQVLIDLSGVTFMSRSAADQLLKEYDRLSTQTKALVQIAKAEPQVQQMLDLVARTRFASAPLEKQTPVTKLEDLDQVMSSWLSIA